MRERTFIKTVLAGALLTVGLASTGCPIFYGWSADEEWERDFRSERTPAFRSADVESIGVVNPFPKKWEESWLYDGGEAERFSHILWQRFPRKHVYLIDLPFGVKPEAVRAKLGKAEPAEILGMLEVDHPVDALVFGSVVESDFDNAYQQGFFTTRRAEAAAYDLEGRKLWTAEVTRRTRVTNITWDIASRLAQAFPN